MTWRGRRASCVKRREGGAPIFRTIRRRAPSAGARLPEPAILNADIRLGKRSHKGKVGMRSKTPQAVGAEFPDRAKSAISDNAMGDSDRRG